MSKPRLLEDRSEEDAMQARELSSDPSSKFMGTAANLTVFALLRGQPMLRRPYLGIGEATKWPSRNWPKTANRVASSQVLSHANASSSAFAFFRSAVLKPWVNPA